MWPDCASWQLEISPVTQISVKLRAKRSRILAVSSVTVKARRSGIRLKVSWLMVPGRKWRLLTLLSYPHPGVLGKEAASYRKERAELLKRGQRGGKPMQGKNLGIWGGQRVEPESQARKKNCR